MGVYEPKSCCFCFDTKNGSLILASLNLIMGVYEPKSCCFCFDTKTGSLILASLNLVGSLLFITSAASGILAFFIQAALEPLVQNHSLDEDQRRNISIYVCIAALAWYSFSSICSCLLIHGIRKDRPQLMLPYLVFDRFMIAMSIILINVLAILSIYIAIVIGTSSVIYMEFSVNAIVLAMGTLLEIYFHLVMNAYHKKVKRALSEDHSILCEEL